MIFKGWSKKTICLILSAAISLGLSGSIRGAESGESAAEDKTLLPTLLFEDRFDGRELDAEKWERCPEMTRCEGMSVWDDRLSYLNGNGQLIVGAEWNEEEKRVHSGAVNTIFSGRYGYYEASIRFPTVYGAWGAFWIMAGDVLAENNSSEDGVEIDVVESISNEKGACHHALHWDGYGAEEKKDGKTNPNLKIYDGKFHTFAVWRTETDYIFYVDGKETWRSQGGGICPLDGYMLLTMESSAWAGGGTEAAIKALPARMEVDYVRVWDSNPYVSDYSGKARSARLKIDDPVMLVNGVKKHIDQQGTAPIIVNNRALLPVRAIVEEFGGAVSWDGETRTVLLIRGENTVSLRIDSLTAYRNGEAKALDAAPVIIGGRTMLPIRFIAESLDLNVAWDGETREITITDPSYNGEKEMFSFDTQAINIRTAKNARQLGGYPCEGGRRVKDGVLLRSGALSWLSKGDANTLANQYNLKYIVDFRLDGERASNPDVEISGARYFIAPVYGDGVFSVATGQKLGAIESIDDKIERCLAYAENKLITERYERFLLTDAAQEAYAKFFDVLLMAGEGEAVIWHSSTGRDGTGIASALLLFALGADEDTIIQDYLISNEAYADEIAEMRAIAKSKGLSEETEVEFIAATKGTDEKYLRLALDSVKAAYGSIDSYLRNRLGLSDEERKALQDKFLQ